MSNFVYHDFNVKFNRIFRFKNSCHESRVVLKLDKYLMRQGTVAPSKKLKIMAD